MSIFAFLGPKLQRRGPLPSTFFVTSSLIVNSRWLLITLGIRFGTHWGQNGGVDRDASGMPWDVLGTHRLGMRLGTHWRSIGDALERIGGSIGDASEVHWGHIGDALGRIVGSIGDASEVHWGRIGGSIRDALETHRDALGRIGGSIGDALETHRGRIGDTLGRYWGRIGHANKGCNRDASEVHLGRIWDAFGMHQGRN